MPLDRAGSFPLNDQGGQERGGARDILEFSQSVDIASTAAQSAVNQDVTVTGLAVGDSPIQAGFAEGLLAGVVVGALGPVGVANTLRLRVTNPTIAAVDPAAAVLTVVVLRS